MAAKSHSLGSAAFEDAWDRHRSARLETSTSAAPVAIAPAAALLSDWFPATTGELVHVDGGFHAVGV